MPAALLCSAAIASGSVAATPPYAQNGSETSEWPKNRLFTSASGRTPTMFEARSARR